MYEGSIIIYIIYTKSYGKCLLYKISVEFVHAYIHRNMHIVLSPFNPSANLLYVECLHRE